MPTIITTTKEWRELRRSEALQGKSLGYVATMGNLHSGHESMITRAKQENDKCVVSIFVNPTQFDNGEDLQNYPRTMEGDLELAERCGVDYIFAPTYEEMYPDEYTYKVSEMDFSTRLEGKYRPGHFDGVLTIVMKLLLLIKPNNAYFGEKDYQQYQLLKDMAEAFFLEVNIVSCPTIRLASGLPFSSRNNRLKPSELKMAEKFPELLHSKRSTTDVKFELQKAGFKVDYIEDYKSRRYGAIFIGPVRLIDNIEIDSGENE